MFQVDKSTSWQVDNCLQVGNKSALDIETLTLRRAEPVAEEVDDSGEGDPSDDDMNHKGSNDNMDSDESSERSDDDSDGSN